MLAKKRKHNCRIVNKINLPPKFKNSANENSNEAMIKGTKSFESNGIHPKPIRHEITIYPYPYPKSITLLFFILTISYI